MVGTPVQVMGGAKFSPPSQSVRVRRSSRIAADS